MGILSDLKASVEETVAKLQTRVNQFKNQAFADATTACLALIVYADGVIDPAEVSEVCEFVSTHPALQCFQVQGLITDFQKKCEQLKGDQFAQAELMATVGKMKGNIEAANTLMDLVIAVAASDGNFDDKEKKVARRICNSLKLDPAGFDL